MDKFLKSLFLIIPISLASISLSLAKSDQFTILRMDGIGPIKVGMSVKEAEKAAGVKLPSIQEEMNDCTFVAPNGNFKEIMFMAMKGKIVRAGVASEGFSQNKSKVRTAEGIGIGDSMKKVKEIYKGRIQSQGHPYGKEEKDFYLLVTPKNPKEKKHLMIFEIMEGTVQTFRSGFKGDVQASEGCS